MISTLDGGAVVRDQCVSQLVYQPNDGELPETFNLLGDTQCNENTMNSVRGNNDLQQTEQPVNSTHQTVTYNCSIRAYLDRKYRIEVRLSPDIVMQSYHTVLTDVTS